MRKRILYLLLLMSVTLWGQSSDQNYIVSKTYKVATTSSIALPTPAQAVTQVQYFDGLGRPIQNVTYAQGGNGKDIITHIEYDPFGRQTKEFLPYAGSTTSLNYHTAAAGEVATFYNTSTYENTTNPYSEKLLENSPLNRLFKQAAPGNVWNMGTNHEIKFDYQTNSVSEVRLYNVTTTWNATTKIYNIALTGGSTSYAPAQLYKNVTVDENTTGFTGARTEEFKDKEGRVVLKRVWATVDSVLTKHDTYYVYDIYGNLTYVIPPEAAVNTLPSVTVLNELCYQYKYDHRNRLVAKKLPGKQWEFIIYDKLDRVRATGPVLSPFSNSTSQGWLYTKYDVFNRTVLTAWVAASSFTEATRLSLQNAVDAVTLNETRTANSTTVTTVNGIAFNYTNVSYPTSGYHVLTANYYDNYNYKDAPTDFASVLGQTLKNPSSNALSCKTLPTGSWVRTLEATTNYNGSLTATQYEYDRLASPVRVKTTRVSGGYTQVDSNTDFEGKTIQTVTRHKRTSADTERVTTEDFTYTAQSRLLSHTHKIGSGTAQLLSYNTYDALGQLTSKKVGNTSASPLQKVDYSYNIRGWLTGINNTASLTDVPNDLFAFKLNYNTTASGLSGVTGLFNGNIAETYWKTASDNNLRLYGYQYDGLNRLSKALYKNNNNGFANTYNESLTYDLNGNIKTLQRNGGTESTTAVAIDNLTYTYDATAKNKLLKVVDATNSTQGFKDDYTFGNDLANDYTYDANGNMTVDQNKGITAIVYNHLNLPSKITFGTTGTINYLYDAAGVKLQKKVTQGTTVTTTDYLGGYQYTDNVLDFFPTAEGYVKHTLVSGVSYYNYVYNYTDHLGNVRVSYTKDPTTGTLKIIEENHNYPFGLKHNYNTTDYQYAASGSGVVLSQVGENGYNYQYNGKEWQDELGYNMYDMDMRQYDPAIARWVVQDPVVHHSMSPYNAFDNNPVFWADPSGASPIYNEQTHQYVINGKVVSFEEALAYANNGGNADGSNDNEPDENQPPFVLQRIKSELRFNPDVDPMGNDMNTGEQTITTTWEYIFSSEIQSEDGQITPTILVVTNVYTTVIGSNGKIKSHTQETSYTAGTDYLNQTKKLITPIVQHPNKLNFDIHNRIINFFKAEYKEYSVAYAVHSKSVSNNNLNIISGLEGTFMSYLSKSNAVGMLAGFAMIPVSNYYNKNFKPREMVLSINVPKFYK